MGALQAPSGSSACNECRSRDGHAWAIWGDSPTSRSLVEGAKSIPREKC